MSSSADAPISLTFGPPFFTLAAEYEGSVILGLNRRLDNLSHMIAAATLAKKTMTNIAAIELWNEPNGEFPSYCLFLKLREFSTVFTSTDPIANGQSWTAAANYASELSWQDAVCGNLLTLDLIPAGVFFGTSPMSIAGLTAAEGRSNE